MTTSSVTKENGTVSLIISGTIRQIGRITNKPKKWLPMKIFPQILLALLVAACSPATTDPEYPFTNGHWIDLTYAYDENTLFWPTAETFALDTVFEGQTDAGYYYSAFQFCIAEHGGTHLDAPVHFAEGQWSTDQIPLEQTLGEAVVVDVSGKALTDQDYQVSVADIQDWEKEHGALPNDIILLIRTGNGRYWPNAEAYLGTVERGEEAVAKLHFPGISPDLATWLVENRSVKAVGLDTPSLDFGQSKLFETHRILFAENIPGFENLANLDQLPIQGAFVIALPMKIRGGSGGPLRMVAWVAPTANL